MSLRYQTEQLCDALDAALFTGDEFIGNTEAREALRVWMRRWTRRLDALAADEEIEL